jgi:hypothetical protein
MIAKFLRNSFLPLFLTLVIYGCFKEDTPIEPVSKNGIRIENSMYHFQSFYDFSSDSVFPSPNNKWDLAFESSASGWRVRINSSNFLGIYRTGSSNFESTDFSFINNNWLYDASSGNPDSTAIGNWQEFTGEEAHVFILGTYDGVRYRPFRKLKFLEVTDTSYSFSFANINNTDLKKVSLKKNPEYNYTYYSLSKKDTVQVEPAANRWDILFTQYTTTLYTDAGVPTPYIVRGVYLNPVNVAAMLDSTVQYSNVTMQHVAQGKLSTVQDYIGYNWKSVEINQSANTAKYAVRRNYSYIVRDTQGDFFKFRFLSYVNDSLIIGYPIFEKEKL